MDTWLWVLIGLVIMRVLVDIVFLAIGVGAAVGKSGGYKRD